MAIKFKHAYRSGPTVDLESAIRAGLEPGYDTNGAAESAREVADKTADAFAKLVVFLVGRGVLTDDEVLNTFDTGSFVPVEG